MRRIPQKLKEEILKDSYYKKCARLNDGYCEGRITWEHAIIYSGRQLNEKWAIIPLCWKHHLGNGLDKDKNVCIALLRATEEELDKISKVINYKRKRDVCKKKEKPQ